MIQEHAQAVLDLLGASTPPLVVHDGRVQDGGTPPYILVYFMVRTPSGEMPADSTSIELDSDRVVLLAYLHCVGGSARTARTMAGRARAALLGVVPDIDGRVCWPIRHDDGQPPQRDERTGVLTQDLLDVYRLESVPG